MKFILLTMRLAVLATGLSLTACNSDYLNVKTEYNAVLCVVRQDAGLPVYLLCDDGVVLHPVSELDSAVYEEGDRFLVTYVVMDNGTTADTNVVTKKNKATNKDYTIRILDMKFVPIRDAVTRDNILSSDGSDAVKLVRDPWFGGDFLNFEFSFRHDEHSDIKHAIWLVCDSMTTEDGFQKGYLTFLHDANGDSPESTTSSLTSFTCSSIQQIGSTDSLIIRVLEWNDSEGTTVVNYRIKNDAKNTL